MPFEDSLEVAPVQTSGVDHQISPITDTAHEATFMCDAVANRAIMGEGVPAAGLYVASPQFIVLAVQEQNLDRDILRRRKLADLAKQEIDAEIPCTDVDAYGERAMEGVDIKAALIRKDQGP